MLHWSVTVGGGEAFLPSSSPLTPLKIHDSISLMNDRSSDQSTQRPYHSEVRAAQKDYTRQRILDTLATQIAQGTFDSLSMEQIAAAAGVGPATLYRYFPNREALLDGLSGYFNQMMGENPHPRTPEEMLQVIERNFPAFDQHPALVKAFFISHLGRSARARGRARRLQAISQALAEVTSHLGEPKRTEVVALIAYLDSLQTWLTMTEEFGLSGAQVGEVVVWAIKTLLAEVSQTREPAKDTPLSTERGT